MAADLAEEAMMALARDLIEEISAGRAIELAQAAAAPVLADPVPVPEPKKGASAVHPNLGGHLLVQPGDTISGHAYANVLRVIPVKPPVV